MENACARLLPLLDFLTVARGMVLYEPGVEMHYVYFPTTAIVSLLYVMENGSSSAFAVVGNEGMVGISRVLGSRSTPSRAVVLNAGHVYRLKAQLLMNEFRCNEPARRLLLRYTQSLLTQIGQTVACNSHHSTEQQVCRWLLLMLDRLPSNELDMTQDSIAALLGVRREAASAAARKLRVAGLIEQTRGRINVHDRAGLEARACECYEEVKSEDDRLLSDRALDPPTCPCDELAKFGHAARTAPDYFPGLPFAQPPLTRG
jgi:CRP-like cAMP-binding protein